jgi:hypothetical protein
MGNMMETIVSFCSAELLFLIMNSRELKALVKRQEERTAFEKSQVQLGLRRTVALEFFVLVPASVCLLVLMLPLALHWSLASSVKELTQGTLEDRLAVRALLGVVSYGFPFAALRDRINRALQALFSRPLE